MSYKPSLPFVDLNEDDFEDLCCDLFGQEQGIGSAGRYGVRGQRQFGIDILASVSGSVFTEVGQCKRYQEFGIGALQEAVKAFLDAKGGWSDWNIRRFLLFVACSVRDKKVQDEYLRQRSIFYKDHGIVFELWGDEQLAQKIRKHRDIAEKYFFGEAVRRLCGSSLNQGAFGTSTVEMAQTQFSLLGEYCQEFEGEVPSEIATIREMARSGHPRQAREKLTLLLQTPRWTLLSNRRPRAQALKLAASLALDGDEIDCAERYLAEGLALNSGESFKVIEAVMKGRTSGADAALEALKEPMDVHEFNVRLALLIQDERIAEAAEAFASCSFEATGETYRLASLISVLKRDHISAIHLAEQALKLSPSWYLVQMHAAKMHYLACILSHFPGWCHLEWPIPPDAEYLKGDADSIGHLETARDSFAKLLDTLECDNPERPLVELWLLACLACNPERSLEARDYAARLIGGKTENIPAAIWAIQRGLEFDVDAFIQKLETNKNTLSPDASQLMVNVLVPLTKISESIALFESSKPSFEKASILHIWRLVRAQLAVLADDVDGAEKIVRDEPEEEHRKEIQIAVLRTKANRSKDYSEYSTFVEQCWTETKNPKYLFDACESWLDTKQPDKILDHSEELLKCFPTAKALRLVLHGAFEAEKYSEYLSLLEKHRSFWASYAVPSAISRMEVRCRQMAGDLLTAAKAAEALARRDPDTLNLVTLLQSQMALGDFRASAVTARDLSDRQEIAPSGLLKIANFIQAEDPQLAIELWEKSVERGLNEDQEVLSAISIGYMLGLDQELGPLLSRLPAIAAKPGALVAPPSVEGLIKMMEKRREGHVEAYSQYRSASVPLHIATAQLGYSYSILFLGQTRRNWNSKCPFSDPPIFLRFGSCLLRKPPGGKMTRMMMDISSILIANFLGILDIVERAFAPILISSSVPGFFSEQIQKTAPRQPEAQKYRDCILTLIKEKRLRCVSLAELLPVSQDSAKARDLLHLYATQQNGLFCDISSEIPEGISSSIVSIWDVVSALFNAGHISDLIHDQASDVLGGANLTAQVFKIDNNSPFVLGMGIAEQLASLGILDILSDLTDLVISQEEVDNLRKETEQQQARKELVYELKTLADRIHSGIRSGRYKTVRVNPEQVEKFAHASAEERCLRDLLGAKGANARVVWCDDRFISKYSSVGGVNSLCITDVLMFLRGKRLITREQYFQKITALFEINGRYISITAELIGFFIRRAQVKNGLLVETHPLQVIRRYVASCCLNREILNPPVIHDGHKELNEMEWVFRTIKEICSSIAGLWSSDEMKNEDREARADWLLNNLFVPVQAVAVAQSGSVSKDFGLEGAAASISLLFSLGFTLNSPWGSRRDLPTTPRCLFFEWINSRLLSRIEAVEPRLLDRIAEIQLDPHYKEPRRKTNNTVKDRMERAVIAKLYVDFPRCIQFRMRLGPNIKAWLGIREPRRVIGIFGRDFYEKDLWRAVIDACNGNTGCCRSLDKDEEFKFLRQDASVPDDTVYVTGPSLEDKTTLSGLPLMLAEDNADKMRNQLLSRPEWFDVGRELMEQTIESITSERDFVERFSKIEEAKELSADWAYQRLDERLRNLESIGIESCIPPNSNSLVNHLRLREGGFSKDHPVLESSASRLISEIGVEHTVERFSTLPISLPQTIRDALEGLDDQSFRELANDLMGRLTSPVSCLHLIHILAIGSSKMPDLLNDAKSLIQKLLSDDQGERDWISYAQIVNWVRREFLSLQDYRCLDFATRLLLIWLHSGRICNIFLSLQDNVGNLRAFFGAAAQNCGFDMPTLEAELWLDVAHPRQLDRASFLCRGLGTIVGMVNPGTANDLRRIACDCIRSAKKLQISEPFVPQAAHFGKNILGSFLGGDAIAPYESLLSFEGSGIKCYEPGGLIEQAIDALTQKTELLTLWYFLAHTLGEYPLPEKIEEKLSSLIEQTSFYEILKDRDDDDCTILYFACARVSSRSSKAMVTHLKHHVSRLISHYAVHPKDNALMVRANWVLNFSALLARTAETEAELFKNYHTLFKEAAVQWPKIAPFMLNAFGRWPINRPLDQQRGLWELILWLRANT